jgi:hypothetical protein
MSSGILSTEVPIDALELRDVVELDQIFRAWTCGGEVSGGLHRFAAVYNGKRPMDAMVFNLPMMVRVVTERTGFFALLGVFPSTPPMDVVTAVDRAERTSRFRGYGHLFGYPDEAVDFFVRADQQQQANGEFVDMLDAKWTCSALRSICPHLRRSCPTSDRRTTAEKSCPRS